MIFYLEVLVIILIIVLIHAVDVPLYFILVRKKPKLGAPSLIIPGEEKKRLLKEMNDEEDRRILSKVKQLRQDSEKNFQKDSQNKEACSIQK